MHSVLLAVLREHKRNGHDFKSAIEGRGKKRGGGAKKKKEKPLTGLFVRAQACYSAQKQKHRQRRETNRGASYFINTTKKSFPSEPEDVITRSAERQEDDAKESPDSRESDESLGALSRVSFRRSRTWEDTNAEMRERFLFSVRTSLSTRWISSAFI